MLAPEDDGPPFPLTGALAPRPTLGDDPVRPGGPDGSLREALANGARLLEHNPAGAVEQAGAILSVTRDQPDALRLLGRALRKLGRPADARRIEHVAIDASFRTPELSAARAALNRGDLTEAEAVLRGFLRQSPDDVAAAMMIADIAARLGIYPEAEQRLRAARDIAPDHAELAIDLALVLFPQGRVTESLSLLDQVIAREPSNIRAAASRADILAQTGDYDAAARTYQALLEEVGDRPEILMWYGHLLKTVGKQQEAVEAYRRATALDPDLAEAWWSLAELKANRVDGADIAAIEQALERAPAEEKQLFLHFALGKALEDRRDWDQSYAHYAAGNRLRLSLEPHDRAAVTEEIDRSIAMYDGAFYAARQGSGCEAPDPIFIVGLPRAGSTLIEQILSSHSQIEGTSELPDIPLMVQALVASRWQDTDISYPEIVRSLAPSAIHDLGERYLASAARHRKSDAPFFIDKLPNNWRYLGLIHLILPNARIIDARREPMACCFSNFKQHFARGQTFAYSQTDIGRYYSDYVRLMRHFDLVAPGLVYRVLHEDLVADPEPVIRRLIDHLGLPFEDACLRPHENNRPVRTASSEQVRRPINRDAVELWRNYEPWLDELKAALGPLGPQ